MQKDVQELNRLYKLLDNRKRSYAIVDFKPQDFQQPLLNAINEKNDEGGNKYRFLLYQWGNWSWKTCIAMYTVACLAMWDLCREYKIPYIGSKKKIFVGTKSGSNLKGLEEYLLWDYSVTRLPPEVVKKVVRDNWGIKEIHLHNWCKITFFTYDQGRERIQWTNGDLYVFDEEPTKSDIFYEWLARLRWKFAQTIYSFTPLSGHTAVYSYFYEQESENVIAQSFITVVNSLQNKHWDHTWAEGLTEQEKKMRIEWLFIPPSGLVYANFNRERNTIPFFDPKDLGNVNFYGALDFWVAHPTAFAAIAVDDDNNIYVFDLIYRSNMLIKDLASKILDIKRCHNVDFEYIVADAAGKRERTELQECGIRTIAADKWSKWENAMSNRRAGILKVNQLLHDGKIFIADHLKDAIKEFEVHHYKDGGTKDAEVDKTNDDFLDALRYFIFNYKPPKYKNSVESSFERRYGKKYSKHAAKNYNTNKPY